MHTCGVVICRFQGGPPTLAHDRSPERLDESRAPHLTSASTVAKFLCKTKKPQSEVVATQVKRKGGGKSHRLAATGPGRVACETTLGHGGMSPTIGGSRGASAASRHRGTATRGLLAAWLTSERTNFQSLLRTPFTGSVRRKRCEVTRSDPESSVPWKTGLDSSMNSIRLIHIESMHDST